MDVGILFRLGFAAEMSSALKMSPTQAIRETQKLEQDEFTRTGLNDDLYHVMVAYQITRKIIMEYNHDFTRNKLEKLADEVVKYGRKSYRHFILSQHDSQHQSHYDCEALQRFVNYWKGDEDFKDILLTFTSINPLAILLMAKMGIDTIEKSGGTDPSSLLSLMTQTSAAYTAEYGKVDEGILDFDSEVVRKHLHLMYRLSVACSVVYHDDTVRQIMAQTDLANLVTRAVHGGFSFAKTFQPTPSINLYAYPETGPTIDRMLYMIERT